MLINILLPWVSNVFWLWIRQRDIHLWKAVSISGGIRILAFIKEANKILHPSMQSSKVPTTKTWSVRIGGADKKCNVPIIFLVEGIEKLFKNATSLADLFPRHLHINAGNNYTDAREPSLLVLVSSLRTKIICCGLCVSWTNRKVVVFHAQTRKTSCRRSPPKLYNLGRRKDEINNENLASVV